MTLKIPNFCSALCWCDLYVSVIVTNLSISINSIAISKQITPGLILLHQDSKFLLLQSKMSAFLLLVSLHAYNPHEKTPKPCCLQHSHRRQYCDFLYLITCVSGLNFSLATRISQLRLSTQWRVKSSERVKTPFILRNVSLPLLFLIIICAPTNFSKLVPS